MQTERNLVKKILYIIKGLGSPEVKLTDIQFIYNDEGAVIGYKIEIKRESPRLTIVPKSEET